MLAVGNFPPADLNIPGLSAGSKQYVRSPWAANALKDIPQNGEVLLIGSGLTSVDQVVALKTEGFAGHIHILSRRGLMPQAHRLPGIVASILERTKSVQHSRPLASCTRTSSGSVKIRRRLAGGDR